MSTSAPAVSVLLPFHRARTTLVECVDSILIQTFAGLEVVAVDDGSPDGSAALISQYAARDPRVRLLRPGRVGRPRPPPAGRPGAHLLGGGPTYPPAL